MATNNPSADDAKPQTAGGDPLGEFIAFCARLHAPRVLELGTKRSRPDVSTLHAVWAPHAAQWLGCDISPGLDVDIVADAHRLSSIVGEESFDAIVSSSTFEHLKYPWVAAHEIMKALKVGGGLFIQTHQAFPVHGYPYDYYRFSREALASLFPRSMGVEVVSTCYEFPASVVAAASPSTADGEAWLNSCLFVRKIASTPQTFAIDLSQP